LLSIYLKSAAEYKRTWEFQILQPRFSNLKINELRLSLKLGCSSDERANRQEVRVSVEIRFPEFPTGAKSDQLADTICYKDLTDRIRRRLESHEYHLIEKVGAEVYELIRELTGHESQLAVLVHKVNPPIDGLLGGTSFSCGDFPL
jgi:FolB domain-containing protein